MKFDEDKSHTISIWELLDAMVVERTPFTEKCVASIDFRSSAGRNSNSFPPSNVTGSSACLTTNTMAS